MKLSNRCGTISLSSQGTDYCCCLSPLIRWGANIQSVSTVDSPSGRVILQKTVVRSVTRTSLSSPHRARTIGLLVSLMGRLTILARPPAQTRQPSFRARSAFQGSRRRANEMHWATTGTHLHWLTKSAPCLCDGDWVSCAEKDCVPKSHASPEFCTCREASEEVSKDSAEPPQINADLRCTWQTSFLHVLADGEPCLPNGRFVVARVLTRVNVFCNREGG
jgi:hypothetical protein